MTIEKLYAMTNAENNNLWHSIGVAGSIVRAEGKIIYKDSKMYIKINGPLPTRFSCITKAG